MPNPYSIPWQGHAKDRARCPLLSYDAITTIRNIIHSLRKLLHTCLRPALGMQATVSSRGKTKPAPRHTRRNADVVAPTCIPLPNYCRHHRDSLPFGLCAPCHQIRSSWVAGVALNIHGPQPCIKLTQSSNPHAWTRIVVYTHYIMHAPAAAGSSNGHRQPGLYHPWCVECPAAACPAVRQAPTPKVNPIASTLSAQRQSIILETSSNAL